LDAVQKRGILLWQFRTGDFVSDQFQQWQELRAKVSKAELGAAQARGLPSEAKVKGNGRKPPKPTTTRRG
jgi:hypothetical protein